MNKHIDHVLILTVLCPASHMIVEDNHQIKDYHIIVVINQCSAWLDYSLPKP